MTNQSDSQILSTSKKPTLETFGNCAGECFQKCRRRSPGDLSEIAAAGLSAGSSEESEGLSLQAAVNESLSTLSRRRQPILLDDGESFEVPADSSSAAFGEEMHQWLHDVSSLQKLYKAEDFDFRLKHDSAAVDKGTVLPTVTEGFSGRAPDLGALEAGALNPTLRPQAVVASGDNNGTAEDLTRRQAAHNGTVSANPRAGLSV